MSNVHMRKENGAAHCQQKGSQNNFVIPELSYYYGTAHRALLKVLVTGCLTSLEGI
jgi:hypothetical protein